MNIEGLGPETVDQFYQEGLIHDIADLYKLKASDIINLERMGEKVGREYYLRYRAIKRMCRLKEFFLRWASVLWVKPQQKTLVKAFKSIDALIHAGLDDLIHVDEIGEKDSSKYYFCTLQMPKIGISLSVFELPGVTMEADEQDTADRTEKLAGKSIVISGVFTYHSRDEYKAFIEKHGGKNVGSISSKTSFILAGDNMGPSKLEKAQKLGIAMVSEEEFLEMIK